MKLSNLIWVLALAGAAMACNSGLPIQGCEIDPATGVCKTQGGGTGGSNGGGGGGGELCVVPPNLTGFNNACTCDSAGEVDINCDYGCTALGNTFGFAAVLDVIPEAGFAGGSASNVEFDGFFVVSEAFIAGAEGVVGDLTTAVVLPGATLPVTALSGATGPDVIVTLPEIELDMNSDPNNNGIKGPFPLPFVPRNGTFTFAASGTDACFNLSTGISFTLDITDPPLFPVPFSCQPANQELINQNNVECPNGDEDCIAPSTCDAMESPPVCKAVIEPEATSGQVCFTIP
jgi:hypothetical protein